MAAALPTNPAPLGVTLDGKPIVDRDAIPAVGDFERVLARNLRQGNACGHNWIRGLLDNPAPEAEEELARLIADSGGRAIRQNEAGLTAQLRTESERAERCRRAIEAVASNPHIAPAAYPPELRDILASALGRPY